MPYFRNTMRLMYLQSYGRAEASRLALALSGMEWKMLEIDEIPFRKCAKWPSSLGHAPSIGNRSGHARRIFSHSTVWGRKRVFSPVHSCGQK